MDKLASSEFRRVYASLTKPTVVTVNGHAIGVWQPTDRAVIAAVAAVDEREQAESRPNPPQAGDRFNTRPFTPVPKRK